MADLFPDLVRGHIERRQSMPGRKHLRDVSSREQRQYEHIRDSAESSGRYGERAKEVAARTVLKQHKQKGHRKGQQGPKARAAFPSGRRISLLYLLCVLPVAMPPRRLATPLTQTLL